VLLAALLAWALAARAAPAPFLIETEFEPARAYVGSEVTLRLRLLRLPEVPYGVLRPPQFGDEAEVTPLGFNRPYETQRGGAVYQVRERAYLVVPRRAGRLVLPAPEVIGPLRNIAEFARGARRATRALEVRPAPATPGEPWLPARRVWLEESWSSDPGALAAGTPVVRTLAVRAEGLSGNRLPRLQMAAQPGMGVHHDASNFRSEYLEAGVAGRRVERIVLMPLEEGEIELPAFHLPWWDVMADEPRVATLPARIVRVGAPSAAPAASAAPPEATPLAVMRGFAIALFALSVLVLGVYLRSQPQREARRQLRAACRRTDPQAVRDALIEWWKAAAPGAPAPLVHRLGDGWDAKARAQLAALDAALYGAKAWDGRAFWRGVRPWLGKRAARRAAAAWREAAAPHDTAARRTEAAGRAAPVASALPPLFRLQAGAGGNALTPPAG
jgi:hypothetical protein